MINLSGPLSEKIAKALEQQEQPVVVETKVETATEPAIQEVTSKEETPSAPETPVNPEVVTEPKEEDWDETQSTPVTQPETTSPALDFSELGKSIGFEAKTKEEFVTKVKELETKALNGVPDNLKKAIELAKKGGDYLSYLKVSQVDYASIDPVELFKSDLYSRLQQLNPQASKQELESAYEEALSSYAPIQQRVEGQKLQKAYTEHQRQEAFRIEQEAAQRKTQADAKIKESIDKLEEVNGFKLKHHHKAAMYDYITSGQLQKDLFSDEGYNYEALVEIAFQRKYGKKANEFLWNKAKTAATKTIVKELTNPQIEKPTTKETVEVKDVHPAVLWLEQLRSRHNK